MRRRIEIVEVGPRDGLQNEKTVLEPAVRAELTRRLEAAGARRIEAVSFVHPKYVPQMAGAEEVMAALPPEPGRSSNRSRSTGNRISSTFGSVSREFVMWVCTPDVPAKPRPSLVRPAGEPEQIVS